MKLNRAIIHSGGSGTRLFPLTKGVSKQLLPIFSKPMIFYPLSTLMLANIRDILIITTPEDQESFKRLLGDGKQLGINLTYAVQPKPEGLAQAFLIAEECGFLTDGDPCALILGDNIFYCPKFEELLEEALNWSKPDCWRPCATIFGVTVKDPERYGIVEVERNNYGTTIVSIEEKPKEPKSNICVTGLYFYPGDVLTRAKAVTPSARGELEITALNQMYLSDDHLRLEEFPRGTVWLDTGTFDSLYEASAFVEAIEKRSGTMISCPEEIAFEKGWITPEQLEKTAQSMLKSEYGQYLHKLVKNNKNENRN